MDSFVSNGPHMVVDTIDFEKVDKKCLLQEIVKYREAIM